MRRTSFARRPLAAAIAGIAVLVSPASVSAQSWVTNPASGSAELISQLFWFTLVLAAIVFVLVEGLLIYSSLRFRQRGPIPAEEPPQVHGNTRLEVMWAIVPALILVGLFGISVSRLGALSTFPTDGMRVSVTGRQFAWEFDYGGARSLNELRIPVGTPVIMEITSADVIHSFWVPELHGKVDANPGRTNRLWFEARNPGTFRGVCAELCGAGHPAMLFRVEAMPAAAFQEWLQQQRTGGTPAPKPGGGAGAPGGGLADEGRALIATKPCGGCHVIPGVPNAVGVVGPSLAGVGAKTSIAGGVVPVRSVDDLKSWILNPPAVKPGTAMPPTGLTDDEAARIAAFLATLR